MSFRIAKPALRALSTTHIPLARTQLSQSARSFGALAEREKTIKIVLLSRRVGHFKLRNQHDLDLLLQRSRAVGLVPEEFEDIDNVQREVHEGEDEDDEVEVITRFSDLSEKHIYEGAMLKMEGLDMEFEDGNEDA